MGRCPSEMTVSAAQLAVPLILPPRASATGDLPNEFIPGPLCSNTAAGPNWKPRHPNHHHALQITKIKKKNIGRGGRSRRWTGKGDGRGARLIPRPANFEWFSQCLFRGIDDLVDFFKRWKLNIICYLNPNVTVYISIYVDSDYNKICIFVWNCQDIKFTSYKI